MLSSWKRHHRFKGLSVTFILLVTGSSILYYAGETGSDVGWWGFVMIFAAATISIIFS